MDEDFSNSFAAAHAFVANIANFPKRWLRPRSSSTISSRVRTREKPAPITSRSRASIAIISKDQISPESILKAAL
jgi:hypothetical protein